MSKIVLDEKEVNELMDTFDFQKSIYLQELKKINSQIEKLEILNQNQIKIHNQQRQFIDILKKMGDKDEKEMMENYSIYLEFLSQKLDNLGKNSELKKIEKITKIADNIVSLSVLKITIVVAVVTASLSFLLQIKGI